MNPADDAPADLGLANDEDTIDYRLAVAYQVVGAFLDYLGIHDSEAGQQLLDYLSYEPGATDPLPFSVAQLLQKAQREEGERERGRE